jgi:hypothetical protein
MPDPVLSTTADVMTEAEVYAATHQVHRGQCVYCFTHNSLEREEDTVLHERVYDRIIEDFVIRARTTYVGQYECKFCHRFQPRRGNAP